MNSTPQQIKSFVERAERLNEDKDAINSDLRELFGEAKSFGLDVKALKMVIRRRAKPEATEELDAIVQLYESALGTGIATHVQAQEAA